MLGQVSVQIAFIAAACQKNLRVILALGSLRGCHGPRGASITGRKAVRTGLERPFTGRDRGSIGMVRISGRVAGKTPKAPHMCVGMARRVQLHCPGITMRPFQLGAAVPRVRFAILFDGATQAIVLHIVRQSSQLQLGVGRLRPASRRPRASRPEPKAAARVNIAPRYIRHKGV